MLQTLKKILHSLSNPYLLRFSHYLCAHRKALFLAVGFMAIAGASSSLIALLLGQLTDLGFYQREQWVILAAPLALLGVAALHGTSMFMSNYLLGKASQGILKTLRGEIFARMLHWPEQTYQENPTGMVASRFVFEANFAMTNAAKAAITLIRDSIQVLALAVLLFWHNALLALVSLLLAPVVVTLLRYINRKMKAVMKANQVSFPDLLIRIKEAYRAQRLIKLADTYERECARFAAVNRAIRQVMVDMAKISALGAPLTQLICMSAVALVFMAALYETQKGMLTVGDFVTFLTALLLILPPLKNLAGLNASLVMMGMAAQGLFSLLDLPLEPDTGKKESTDCRGRVVFDHVSFRYPGAQEDAVHDISLTVEPGKCLALVGASGSGKSSLMNLLPRFWNPTAGRIFLDGTDTQELTLASLRAQIAVVCQDITLFNTTIRRNLTFGCPHVFEEEIQRALQEAALSDFVAGLPLGLDTPVGEDGALLSGGQRQRLAIARAFLKNAPILILDEATSALDSETEALIQQSLKRLLQGRTAFLIAHRFSSLSLADHIAVLDHGRLVEYGTQQELWARGGIFVHLAKLQSVQAGGSL